VTRVNSRNGFAEDDSTIIIRPDVIIIIITITINTTVWNMDN